MEFCSFSSPCGPAPAPAPLSAPLHSPPPLSRDWWCEKLDKTRLGDGPCERMFQSGGVNRAPHKGIQRGDPSHTANCWQLQRRQLGPGPGEPPHEQACCSRASCVCRRRPLPRFKTLFKPCMHVNQSWGHHPPPDPCQPVPALNGHHWTPPTPNYVTAW